MTRTEHLLTILAEECAEVAQRVSKALRFGLEEVQPGQPRTNAERIKQEMIDLVTVYQMLVDDRMVPEITVPEALTCEAEKRAKVEKFLRFSASRGLVDGIDADPSFPHPEAV